MAWTQTSATDLTDLLAQLRTYLLANGWTSGGANIVTSSEGHKFRLTSNLVLRNTFPFADPDVPDNHLQMEYDETVIGGAGYSGFGNAGGARWLWSNDFTGPFPNLWFFTDGKFCHVAAQSGANRYSHASFGSLDDKGMHAQRVPYIAALFYYWWRNQEVFAGNDNAYPSNWPSNGNHNYGALAWDQSSYVAIPDGIADPALDFADGPIFNPTLVRTASLWPQYDSGNDGNSEGYALDYLTSIENKAITGGVPLSPFPFVAYGADGAQLWLGEIPNMRFCKMNGLNPAQTITYAGEDWIVFPIKQLGSEASLNYGGNPQPEPNTVQYGYAYRKA